MLSITRLWLGGNYVSFFPKFLRWPCCIRDSMSCFSCQHFHVYTWKPDRNNNKQNDWWLVPSLDSSGEVDDKSKLPLIKHFCYHSELCNAHKDLRMGQHPFGHPLQSYPWSPLLSQYPRTKPSTLTFISFLVALEIIPLFLLAFKSYVSFLHLNAPATHESLPRESKDRLPII